MTAVLQGTHDNYNIDHFKKIIEASSDITKAPLNNSTIASHRVISDHLRASSFLIAEGILPSSRWHDVSKESLDEPGWDGV